MRKIFIRTRDWKEMRRFRALELKRAGWTHAEVAEALGVTEMAVSKWMKAVREERVKLACNPVLPRELRLNCPKLNWPCLSC